MTTETPGLAVHVFGAGKGEGVVLGLPNGRWGVVDCFARSSADPRTNPVLQFLTERGVKELEFLCLTHPHDDHYKGMSHLLESLTVRYFWPSAGLSGLHFKRLVAYLRNLDEETSLDDDLKISHEFVRIFGLVQEKRENQSPRLLQKVPGPTTQLYPVPYDPVAEFQVVGLAPSGDQVSRYNRGLLGCFDEKGGIRDRLPRAHHNIISSALLVTYGETRIILGGDVEREGWQDVVRDMGAERLAANAVKISHHGSTNGYCDGLWSLFSASGKPVGIVTAYVSQKLPRREALDHIAPCTDHLLTTCMTALGEDQLPTSRDSGVLRSRLALRTKMGRLSDEERHGCGRCTLRFDNQGNCVDIELVPPAGRLQGQVR